MVVVAKKHYYIEDYNGRDYSIEIQDDKISIAIGCTFGTFNMHDLLNVASEIQIDIMDAKITVIEKL